MCAALGTLSSSGTALGIPTCSPKPHEAGLCPGAGAPHSLGPTDPWHDPRKTPVQGQWGTPVRARGISQPLNVGVHEAEPPRLTGTPPPSQHHLDPSTDPRQLLSQVPLAVPGPHPHTQPDGARDPVLGRHHHLPEALLQAGPEPRQARGGPHVHIFGAPV